MSIDAKILKRLADEFATDVGYTPGTPAHCSASGKYYLEAKAYIEAYEAVKTKEQPVELSPTQAVLKHLKHLRCDDEYYLSREGLAALKGELLACEIKRESSERVAELEAQVEKWHSAAMKAGVFVHVGGVLSFPMIPPSKLGPVKKALKGLIVYVQQQAAANNLEWSVLAENHVLVNAMEALSQIEGENT